ncbi:hypothetical protein H6F90_19270 [Trichocoleus sp. FACHB-591]|nr:hypothetical protein [Trichocoleus sp. FACHB-591]
MKFAYFSQITNRLYWLIQALLHSKLSVSAIATTSILPEKIGEAVS